MILESPFAGNIEENIKYARMAVRDSLLRGEAPIASHLLYTQDGILDDNIPEERKLGIDAGLAWGKIADKTVVYVDKGISGGMKYGIERAIKEGRKIEFRSLPYYSGARVTKDYKLMIRGLTFATFDKVQIEIIIDLNHDNFLVNPNEEFLIIEVNQELNILEKKGVEFNLIR
ncbi:DUF7768 domain-containing protein [Robertmurraya siralis]